MEKREPRVSHVMPCSVVLLSAGSTEESDAQNMTHEFVEVTGEFTLNIASTEQVSIAKKLGALHGKNQQASTPALFC